MTIKTQEITQEDILSEVLEGLSRDPKQLPSKLFYDEKGSQLFDEICELDEYYPTRTEMKIMKDNIKSIIEYIGRNALLIEFGSGSSLKTKLLLKNIKKLSGYIPIDISYEHLIASVGKLEEEFPGIDVYPLAADFTKPFDLPVTPEAAEKKVAYYPGSTIGNFTPAEAKEFLATISELVGKGGGLLIGIDLRKNTTTLEAAYNDAKGVTAKFNLNILQRLNNELDADFNISLFRHFAFFNTVESRIEMHLISREQQKVNIAENAFYFEKGETILTEYSYKYSIEAFSRLAEDYFEIKKIWSDPDNYFAVIYLEV